MLDTDHLQLRWFAALLAMRRLDARCRQLLDTLRSADEAWRCACIQLAALEAMTEALENQLMAQDETPAPQCKPRHLEMNSAA